MADNLAVFDDAFPSCVEQQMPPSARMGYLRAICSAPHCPYCSSRVLDQPWKSTFSTKSSAYPPDRTVRILMDLIRNGFRVRVPG